MRKSLLTLLGVVFMVSMLSVAVAFAEEVKAEGTVKAMDPAKGTKDELVIKATPADVKGIKAGQKVKITFDKGKENVAKRIIPAREVAVPKGC